MYNKHVFVHDSRYGWSTLPYRIEDNYNDIVCKCDLELVYLKNWVFGEVKKIRAPIVLPDADKKTPKKPKESKATADIIPSNVTSVNIITHNVPGKSDRTLRKWPAVVPKKMTERKSNRKCQNVDYSKLDASTEEPSPHASAVSQTYCANPQKLFWKPIKSARWCPPVYWKNGYDD